MKLHRTALATAVVLSSLAGGAYAGNYGNTSEEAQSHRSNPVSKEQQQQQSPSGNAATGTSPGSTAMPSGDTAPANPSNVRDRQALDTNNDGVISADEQKRVHPGQSGAADSSGAAGTSTGGTGSDASGTQPHQGPGTSGDKLRDGTTGNPTPGSMNRPDQMQRY